MEKILIREDGRKEGRVFNKVINPTVVYNSAGLIKIGEKEAMYDYFNDCMRKYREKNLEKYADDWGVLELPRNQELVDAVMGTHDYVLKLVKELK